MRRRSPLLSADPMTRLVAASVLLSAGAVGWALWPAGPGTPASDGSAAPRPATASPQVLAQSPAARPAAVPASPPAPSRTGSAAASSAAEDSDLDAERTTATAPATGEPEDRAPAADLPAEPATETLYLTIVGDQTFVRRGAAGQRAEPGPGWTGAAAGPQTLAAALSGEAALPTGATADPMTGLTAPTPGPAAGPQGPAAAAPADRGRLTSGQPVETPPDNEEPLVDRRPWPQPGCPWTLGPEAGQSMADQLRDLYGCRYLSACQVQTGMCTWHYQGSS